MVICQLANQRAHAAAFNCYPSQAHGDAQSTTSPNKPRRPQSSSASEGSERCSTSSAASERLLVRRRGRRGGGSSDRAASRPKVSAAAVLGIKPRPPPCPPRSNVEIGGLRFPRTAAEFVGVAAPAPTGDGVHGACFATLSGANLGRTMTVSTKRGTPGVG